MRNEPKRKVRELGTAALEELNQQCCMLSSVNEAENRSRHFTLTFRCHDHGRYWCAVQYVEDIPDELIKTEIKIEVLGRAFSRVPNGSAKTPPGAAKNTQAHRPE
jgi:hypothetical protein